MKSMISELDQQTVEKILIQIYEKVQINDTVQAQDIIQDIITQLKFVLADKDR